jgi:hypothetical protein
MVPGLEVCHLFPTIRKTWNGLDPIKLAGTSNDHVPLKQGTRIFASSILHNENVSCIATLFPYIIPLRSPGDRNRISSAIASFVATPISKAEKNSRKNDQTKCMYILFLQTAFFNNLSATTMSNFSNLIRSEISCGRISSCNQRPSAFSK